METCLYGTKIKKMKTIVIRTDKTHNMFNVENMKNTSLLVNSPHSGIINERDLVHALNCSDVMCGKNLLNVANTYVYNHPKWLKN